MFINLRRGRVGASILMCRRTLNRNVLSSEACDGRYAYKLINISINFPLREQENTISELINVVEKSKVLDARVRVDLEKLLEVLLHLRAVRKNMNDDVNVVCF